jgi:hypothetical protein
MCTPRADCTASVSIEMSDGVAQLRGTEAAAPGSTRAGSWPRTCGWVAGVAAACGGAASKSARRQV